MLTIAVYLIGMVVIGILFSSKNNTSGDFYLGGRRLGPFVTAMSAEASDMSSWLLMGLPGVAYLSGICDAGWTAIGLAVGTYINWLIVAKRIRNYTFVCNNSITLPSFFSNRFRDKSRLLVVISALITVFFGFILFLSNHVKIERITTIATNSTISNDVLAAAATKNGKAFINP